jgi:hypothetical protein
MVQRLSDFLGDVIPEEVAAPVVILIDKIDSTV